MPDIDMSIQERYDDIVKISGLSEEIVRRVFKATRQSIAKSIKHGKTATVPGIATFIPEVRSKLNTGGVTITQYIKVKAKPSSSLETELEKLGGFSEVLTEEEFDNGLGRLNLVGNYEIPRYNPNSNGIRTTQISALL